MSEVIENQEPSGQELEDKFRKARDELFASIKKLKRSDMKLKSLDGWSVRDILAHIIEWDFRSVEDAQGIVADETIDTRRLEDMDGFNREVLQNYEKWSMNDIFTGLGLSTRQVLNFLRSKTEDKLNKGGQLLENGQKVTVRWLMDYSDHDIEHAKQIREWREEKGI